MPDSNMPTHTRAKLLPFALTLVVLVADQITKALIVANIDPYTIGAQFLGDFLRIIHARNPGIAFSLGAGLPQPVRTVLFTLLPLAVIAFLVAFYWKADEITRIQRWAVAGIIGGGLGNLIDRIFRPEGVVDFIDVKFYGLFGLERWPTFNVADASVVVCGILLIVTMLFEGKADT
jgi:signal peptidase II